MSKKSLKNIGWVIEQLEKGREYPQKQMKVDTKSKYISSDRNLWVCPDCKITWQPVKRPTAVEYYEDFPTYKIPRKKCPRC